MSNSPLLPVTLIGPLDARAFTPPLTSSSEIGPFDARADSVPEKPETPIGPFAVSTSIDVPSGAVTTSCTLQFCTPLRLLDRPVTRTRLPSIVRRTLSAAACASASCRAPAPMHAVMPKVLPVPRWIWTPPFDSGRMSSVPAETGTVPCCSARATS